MTNREQLYTWLSTHMPELHTELIAMPPGHARLRLNAATGAHVRSCDTKEDGAAVHLAAFQDLSGQQ